MGVNMILNEKKRKEKDLFISPVLGGGVIYPTQFLRVNIQPSSKAVEQLKLLIFMVEAFILAENFYLV